MAHTEHAMPIPPWHGFTTRDMQESIAAAAPDFDVTSDPDVAMAILSPDPDVIELEGEEFQRVWDAASPAAHAARADHGPNWRQAPLSVTDEVDRLIHHIRDTGFTLNEATYSIKLAAGLNAEHDWSTGLIEISYTELNAIRAILALRPR